MSGPTIASLIAVALGGWLLIDSDDDPSWRRAVYVTLLASQTFLLGVRAPLTDLGEALVGVAHTILMILLGVFLAGTWVARRSNR